MASQRKAGAILGYLNIIVKNLVNLVYTPMLLSFVRRHLRCRLNTRAVVCGKR